MRRNAFLRMSEQEPISELNIDVFLYSYWFALVSVIITDVYPKSKLAFRTVHTFNRFFSLAFELNQNARNDSILRIDTFWGNSALARVAKWFYVMFKLISCYTG